MYTDARWNTPVIAPVQLSPERQALLDAADYIDRHGWCQRAIETFEGQVCAAGALFKIGVWERMIDRGVTDGAIPFYILLQHVGADIWPSIPAWNDAPGQTKEKVISAMRAAALDGWE